MTIVEHPARLDGIARELPIALSPNQVREMQNELQRFMLEYDFGMREI